MFCPLDYFIHFSSTLYVASAGDCLSCNFIPLFPVGVSMTRILNGTVLIRALNIAHHNVVETANRSLTTFICRARVGKFYVTTTPIFPQFPRNNHRWKADIVRTLGKYLLFDFHRCIYAKSHSQFHSAESPRDQLTDASISPKRMKRPSFEARIQRALHYTPTVCVMYMSHIFTFIVEDASVTVSH